MICCNRASVSSNPQESRAAFCCISSADVATPPAFDALPGAKSTPASLKACTASGVHGMFAPSATATTPLRTRLDAADPSSSFCVAHGRATSTGTSQIDPAVRNSAEPRRSAYWLMRARSTSLTCLSRSTSMPSSSTTYPLESEHATTVAPSAWAFSMA